MSNPADPDFAAADAVAHERLASLEGLTAGDVDYLDHVGAERDEFTDLECTDLEVDGDLTQEPPDA